MKHCLITVLLLVSPLVRGEGHVIINEAQSSNGETLTDQLGENSDWIGNSTGTVPLFALRDRLRYFPCRH